MRPLARVTRTSVLSPRGRPFPFDSADEPVFGSDSDQRGGRLQEALARGPVRPRAEPTPLHARSSESGVEFGDVLRLIFDRITSGLLGAGRTLCRRLGTRTPLRTLCQALTQ